MDEKTKEVDMWLGRLGSKVLELGENGDYLVDNLVLCGESEENKYDEWMLS